MKRLIVGLLWALLWVPSISHALPKSQWGEELTPLQRGWDTDRLDDLKQKLDNGNTTVFLLIDSKNIIMQYGDITAPMPIHDMQLALLNAALGVAYESGKFKLLENISDATTTLRHPLNDFERNARVQDLLSMRFLTARRFYDTDKTDRSQDVRHGFEFAYNVWTAAFLEEKIIDWMDGANFSQVFGQNIADKIGFRHMRRFRHFTQAFSPYTQLPRTEVVMSADDLARFALLYLQEGRWEDTQILPKTWVKNSLQTQVKGAALRTTQIDPPGFGWLWWTSHYGRLIEGVSLPDGSFAAKGRHGQYVVVVPERQWIIVHLTDHLGGANPVTEAEFGELLALLLKAKRPIGDRNR